MSNANIIYSVGIYQGGGLIVLKDFIKYSKNSFFYFDSRLHPSFYKNIKFFKVVKNNFISKLILQKKLSKIKKNIYFINGLPPIFKYKGIVAVLFQNTNVFLEKNFLDFLFWIFSKDFMRYIIYILGRRYIYLWIKIN